MCEDGRRRVTGDRQGWEREGSRWGGEKRVRGGGRRGRDGRWRVKDWERKIGEEKYREARDRVGPEWKGWKRL